jgi:hypothetical protein
MIRMFKVSRLPGPSFTPKQGQYLALHLRLHTSVGSARAPRRQFPRQAARVRRCAYLNIGRDSATPKVRASSGCSRPRRPAAKWPAPIQATHHSLQAMKES